MAAALFALHPLQSEPVASIVGRGDLLAGVGVLGGILCHIIARRREVEGRRSGRWFSGAVLFYIAALFSKEHAIVLPAILLLYDVRFVAKPEARRFMVYLLYGTMAAVYLAMRIRALEGGVLMGEIALTDNPLAHVEWPRRVVSALWIAGLYIWHVLIPVGLSPDYSYAVILPFESTTSLGALLTIAGAGALAGAGVYLAVRSTRCCVALVITLFTFLPVSNLLFPIGTPMGDRLFYLPLAGLSLLGGVAWTRLPSSWQRGGGWSGVLVVLAVLAILATHQTSHWRDRMTLFGYAVEATPQSYKAHNNLGDVYLDRGDFVRAAQAFGRALEIDPDAYLANAGLATAAVGYGDWTLALRHVTRALELRPGEWRQQMVRGRIHKELAQWKEAEHAWLSALEHEPTHSPALDNLGTLAWTRGNVAKAIRYWERSSQFPAASFVTWFNLGMAYEKVNEIEKAIEAYERAVAFRGATPVSRSRASARIAALKNE
jgi:Tfp pilus assembly protein PilF